MLSDTLRKAGYVGVNGGGFQGLVRFQINLY